MFNKLICKIKSLRKQPEGTVINSKHRPIIEWYANNGSEDHDSAASVMARKVLRDESQRIEAIRSGRNQK